MTEKEISKASATAQHGTKAYKELSCRRMINSLLCYHYYDIKEAKKIIELEKARYHDYLKQYVEELGEQRVIELINEQRASIYAVLFNVGEDNEGLSYNSTIFVDEVNRILTYRYRETYSNEYLFGNDMKR